MSGSSEGPRAAEGKKLPETFPVGDAFLDKYVARPESTRERVDAMKEVLRTILAEEVKNTELHRSETFDAEFPYTVIRVEDVARDLFARFSGMKQASPAESVEPARPKLEFVIGGFQVFTPGHEYEYAEFAISAIIQALPEALRALQEGRDPTPHAIYTLGSPVSDIGFAGGSFAHHVEQDPIRTLAELYAEEIEHELGKYKNSVPALVLRGISMGSSIVAETADVLIQEGVATQNPMQKDTPRVEVDMYIPVAVDRSPAAAAQMVAGFFGEGAYQWLVDPAVSTIMSGTGKFVEASRALSGKEFPVRMDERQKKLKDSVVKSIRSKLLGGGISVPNGIKTNQIVGEFDPLMYSPTRGLEFVTQNLMHPGSLGEDLIQSSTDPHARVFGAEMSHRVPFYRDTEFRRWDGAADAVNAIRRGSK